MCLCYNYNKNKWCYYTDGHERKDVVQDWSNRFLIEYLERQTYHWVHTESTIAMKFEEAGKMFPKKCSYDYTVGDSSVKYRECYIDTYRSLGKFIVDGNKAYGGNLSIRFVKKKRQLIMLGQDESTYHQYIFSKKQWIFPTGQKNIMPKGVSETLKISDYQSREFRLGLRA